jgi:thiosulfate dehydrogenase [quinone] large subunit
MNIQSATARRRTVEHFEDPPVAQALFGHVRWAWIWLILRLYAGWVWVQAGWEKLHDPAWTGAKAGAALSGFVNHALTETSGAHPNVEGWYAWFLQDAVLADPRAWSYLVSLLMLAWKTAGWWGLDRWILPVLGTPWRPGAVLRPEGEEGVRSMAERPGRA